MSMPALRLSHHKKGFPFSQFTLPFQHFWFLLLDRKTPLWSTFNPKHNPENNLDERKKEKQKVGQIVIIIRLPEVVVMNGQYAFRWRMGMGKEGTHESETRSRFLFVMGILARPEEVEFKVSNSAGIILLIFIQQSGAFDAELVLDVLLQLFRFS